MLKSVCTIMIAFFVLSYFGLTNAQTLKVTKNGNLRSGPGTNNEIIGKVSIGLKVYELDKTKEWYKVKLPDGTTGWLNYILVQQDKKEKDLINEFIIAAAEDNIERVNKYLKEGLDVNSKGDYGVTALYLASEHNHIDMVRLLLDAGADINAKDNKNWTPLLVAAYYGCNETLEILINRGANVNDKSIDGWTALMYLCYGKMSISLSQSGHLEIAELLIANGADVNATNNGGKKALNIAYYSGYIDLIQLLAKQTPPPKEENVDESPYFVAVEEMPEPIGGFKGIQDNIIYPEIAKSAGVEGKVYVLAFVDETGTVTKAQIIKGIGAGCDEAAIDAVLKTKFKPGKQRGKPVKVQVSIPVLFKIQSDSEH